MSLVPLPELLEEHRRIAAAVGNGRFLGVPDTPLGPQQADEDAEEEAAEEAAAAEAPDERAADESQLDEEGNPLTPPPPPAAPARAAKPPKPVVFTEAHRLAWTVHGASPLCSAGGLCAPCARRVCGCGCGVSLLSTRCLAPLHAPCATRAPPHLPAAIAADTTLVPAGAFVVEPNGGGVSVNPSFTGINPSLVGGDASVLASLLHFRPPTAPERQRALAHGGLLAPGESTLATVATSRRSAAAALLQRRGGLSDSVRMLVTPPSPPSPPRARAAASWLDPASEDTPLPSIVWAVRKDASAGDGRLRLVARSLKWPGANFVMAIGGPDFGNFYVGQGTEEMALPFMV